MARVSPAPNEVCRAGGMNGGQSRRPTEIAIRGFTDTGDTTENFKVDDNGSASWTTVIDSGSAPFAGKHYNTYGGPLPAFEFDIDALVAAGDKGIDLLPTGHA